MQINSYMYVGNDDSDFSSIINYTVSNSVVKKNNKLVTKIRTLQICFVFQVRILSFLLAIGRCSFERTLHKFCRNRITLEKHPTRIAEIDKIHNFIDTNCSRKF